MARIIGGIAPAHSDHRFAHDAQSRTRSGLGADLRRSRPSATGWRPEARRDRDRYNDHVTSFFFDHYSAFALGIGEGTGRPTRAVAREGPAVDGNPACAAHRHEVLVADEFDMSFFQDKPLDHGVFSPLSVLLDTNRTAGRALVPLQVGVLQFPIPSAKRCFKLGHGAAQGDRELSRGHSRSPSSAPADCRIRCTVNGPASTTPWDRIPGPDREDPETLTEIPIAEYAGFGGCEGAEVVMWLVMRGALNKRRSGSCTRPTTCPP